jgi:RNA polymerase sigma factor (sigma-70 family)
MRADVSAAFTEEHESGPRVPARLLRLASDERLVERVRRGSEAAFEAIFDRYHRGILGFCRHMLGSVEEAEDAVQHTFMAAFRELAGSDKPIQLKPWLYTIARNRCLTVLRTRSRQTLGELEEPPTEHLAAEVERRHDLRNLLRDVASLPDDQRSALVLSELGDMSHDDIAAVLDCRREKVKALVFQARSSLIASREARETPCADIREQLANLRGGSLRRTELRRHLRECPGCRAFRDQVREQRRDLAVVLPVAPSVGLKAAAIGGTGAGAGAGAGAVSGSLAAKVILVAALATGGTVAVEQTTHRDAAQAPPAPARATKDGAAPRSLAQPVATVAPAPAVRSHPTAPARHGKPAAKHHHKKHHVATAAPAPPATSRGASKSPAKGGVPPGQAKVPPGQAKKQAVAPKTPPGQAKKPVAAPPGQAKKPATIPKTPPAHAKKIAPSAPEVAHGLAKGLAKP